MNVSIAPLVCLLALLAPAAQAAPAKKSAHPKAHPKPAAAAPAIPAVNPRVALQTNKGRIVLEVYADKAPKTAKNFLDYVKSGFYNNTIFHRVIPGFMIQGGDPLGSGRGGPGYTFKDEFSPDLGFNRPYLLAMANSGPSTNGSQFFITVAPTTWLTGKHTIFGEVTSGTDVVDSIVAVVLGALGQADEVLHRRRRVVREQVEGDVATVGLQCGR